MNKFKLKDGIYLVTCGSCADDCDTKKWKFIINVKNNMYRVIEDLIGNYIIYKEPSPTYHLDRKTITVTPMSDLGTYLFSQENK
jgi:hypothetical protein